MEEDYSYEYNLAEDWACKVIPLLNKELHQDGLILDLRRLDYYNPILNMAITKSYFKENTLIKLIRAFSLLENKDNNMDLAYKVFKTIMSSLLRAGCHSIEALSDEAQGLAAFHVANIATEDIDKTISVEDTYFGLFNFGKHLTNVLLGLLEPYGITTVTCEADEALKLLKDNKVVANLTDMNYDQEPSIAYFSVYKKAI